MLPFTVVTVLLTAALVSREHHVSCSTEPKQPEKDDITLRCRLYPPVNLLDYTLDISRADIDNVVVHAYRDGKDLIDPQTSWYRDRTTLVHEDLQRGTITLNISSVQLSDRGQYKLLIQDPNVGHPPIIHDIYLDIAEKGRGLGTTTRTEAPRTRETPDAEPQKQQVGAIVGGAVGVGAVVLLVIVGVLVKCGNSSRRRYTPGRNTEEDKHIGDVHNNNNNNNNNPVILLSEPV